MRIHTVKLDLPLSDDQFVDLFLIQWRTPMQEEEGLAPAVIDESAVRKGRVLEGLCTWLLREQKESRRPLLILTPEVSTPIDLLSHFERLIAEVNRPAVAVAGIEYLDPGRYRDLISRSRNPEKGLWIEGVDGSEKVNAAVILTRGADGTLGLYIQPKVRPADPEQRWRVYGSQDVLLFHHKSHGVGEGLQFCIQICSDFCSEQHVSLLREKISGEFQGEDLRLDLSLLLQCNQKQEMPQFRDGANEYFAVAHRGKVRTKYGALLMLNNASSTPGTSALWGNSQFRFPYGSWKQAGGEFTYWLTQESGELWQAATFRESGPSVYWITYKPHYLCDHRPGSGDSQPFRDALCWNIGNPDDTVPSFKPVSAVMHWLLAEWTNSAAALAKSLAQQGVNKELATIIGDTYSSGVVEWSAALHDEVAKQAIKTLFVCFRRPGYPYGTTDYAETEPKKWDKNPDVARAATEMLRLHTLLRMGASSCNTEFHAAPLRERHALLKSTRTTYVWGGGEMMAEKMAEDYQGLLSLSDRTSAECFVIVLMKPRNQTDPDELEKHLFDRIDQASAPADGGPHLKEGQGVTRGEAWRPIFLYDHEIEDALSQREPSAAQRQLSAAVQGVLERAARN